MITEDFVSFEIAKLLKEKGFEENCYTHYSSDGQNVYYNYQTPSDGINIPTLQMAMKWLREVHKIHVSIEMGFDVDNRQYFFFAPSICKFSNKTGEYQTPFGEKEFDTYEEACETAIKYCLENLI